MSWAYWPFFLRWTFLPLGLLLPFAYLYSRALIRGIEFTRIEEHRIVPEGPWFFFNRKFVPHALRLAITASLSVFIAHCGARLLQALRYSWKLDLDLAGSLVVWKLIANFGLAGFLVAFITLLAPRFRSATSLTAWGISVALLLQSLLAWTALRTWEVEDNAERSETFRVNPALQAYYIFSVFGVACFYLTWLYVRRKLNRAWFRFDE